MVSATAIENVFSRPLQQKIAPRDQRTYLVGGELRQWDGPVQQVHSPISDQNGPVLIGSYPLMGESESLEALNAAYAAFDNGSGLWPTMSVEERIGCLRTFVNEMRERREAVVTLLMWEIAKSRADSEKEFDRTVKYIEDTVEALKELDRISSRFVINEGIVGQIRRAPLGVALCMGPHNYPLNETFTTLIPALLMGNTVIFRPPRIGVLLHEPLLEAFRKSFPPGVVNTIYGRGRTVITPLMGSGKIDVLAFIGGSAAADAIRKEHPKPHRLRCVLGLEAKNAAIILEDADLDLAVKECLLGTLSFNGQRCTALKMLFLHEAISKEFLRKFTGAIDALTFGMPWDEGVFVTPVADPERVPYLSELLADAVKKGATVGNACGGLVNRSFFYPAVVLGVGPEMRLYHEEQFGPIIPVRTFSDVEEPIRYVRESNYGQQVALFGTDADRIAALIDPLVNQVCRVNLNSQCQRGPDTFPFVGRKDSAEGTLSVSDALRVFSIRTLVAAKINGTNKAIIDEIVRERKSNFLSTDFIL